MKIVLATLSRHTYSGWALYIEGKPASSQIGEVTLDRSLSHFELTKEAMKAVRDLASRAERPVELYVVDDRQRGGLRHPSQGPLLNIIVHNEPPRDSLTRKARAIIESKYHDKVKVSPFDGDPTSPFLIYTATEMHVHPHSGAPFAMDAAGTGVILAASGDIHTGRNMIRVPRHDDVIAELAAIQSGLMMALKKLPTLRSARERAIICTNSQEALDAIAYPWGGSKARRVAAGKVIELLNRIKCGDKMDQYAAIFRLNDGEENAYQASAKALASLAVGDYSALISTGRRKRQEEILDHREALVRENLITSLGGGTPVVIPKLEPPVANAKPLFHFPTHKRRNDTIL